MKWQEHLYKFKGLARRVIFLLTGPTGSTYRAVGVYQKNLPSPSPKKSIANITYLFERWSKSGRARAVAVLSPQRFVEKPPSRSHDPARYTIQFKLLSHTNKSASDDLQFFKSLVSRNLKVHSSFLFSKSTFSLKHVASRASH